MSTVEETSSICVSTGNGFEIVVPMILTGNIRFVVDWSIDVEAVRKPHIASPYGLAATPNVVSVRLATNSAIHEAPIAIDDEIDRLRDKEATIERKKQQ